MTDLPKAIRDELVADLLPQLLTPLRAAQADDGATIKYAWRLHDGALVESRAHALPGPGHHLRLEPGRLRHELPVLRDRPGRADPQHVGRRDRRAGRAQAARRAAPRASIAGRPRGRDPLRGQQRRLHGHGRGAGQLQGRDRRDPPAHRPGARRAGHVRPRHHHVDGRPGARRSTSWRARASRSRLALSLHAPDDELRDELVPINTRWKVDEALDAAHRYFEATGRRVSIEYALIRDINDQAWRADLLGRRSSTGAGAAGCTSTRSRSTRRPARSGPPRDPRVEQRVRRAAARPRHPDDGPRHARPGHRRRLRPARRRHRLSRPGDRVAAVRHRPSSSSASCGASTRCTARDMARSAPRAERVSHTGTTSVQCSLPTRTSGAWRHLGVVQTRRGLEHLLDGARGAGQDDDTGTAPGEQAVLAHGVGEVLGDRVHEHARRLVAVEPRGHARGWSARRPPRCGSARTSARAPPRP